MIISKGYPCCRSHKGFTLIEVLISLIVAVVGIVAILQLQGVFLSIASDSQQRALATSVAEKKLEELRGFDSVSTTSSSLKSFDDIVSGSGTESVTAGSKTYAYDLAWTVTPYTISGASINVASAANSDFKNVTLNVSWGSSTADSVSLSSIIGAINPQIGNFIDKTGLGGGAPQVDFTPGGAPDVIPVDVGGGKARETSKPLPDVDQSNESTEVRFKTVTYDKTSLKQVDAEDFATVNCFCVLDASATHSGTTPYHHKYDSSLDNLDVAAGAVVNDLQSGSPYTQGNFTQSNLCTRCCSQHHDSPSYQYSTQGKPRYDNTATSGKHAHYKFSVTPPVLDPPVLVEATTTGQRYLESCRFRRVNGIYRLFPNWDMNAFNVMPYSYLASSASSSLGTYQQYIKNTVQDSIFATSTAVALTGRDFTANNAEKNQLLARGIYFDDMSYDANWNAYMSNVASSSALLSANDWLAYVPFYEINMSLLSTWSSGNTAAVTVTNDHIDTVVDEAANYYGVYSRGVATMAASGTGSAAITAYSKDDNTGIVGNTYGNPSSYFGKDNRIIPSPTVVSSSLVATIGSCAPNCPITISGIIYKNKGLDLDTVAVSVTSGTCSYTHVGNATTASFNCQIPNGSSGNKVIRPTSTLADGYITPLVTAGGGTPSGTVVSVTSGSAATDGTVTVNVTSQAGITGINFDLTK